MRTIFEANSVPIIVALLVGLMIGWWMFRRSRSSHSSEVSPEARQVEADPPVPARFDTPEGNGLADQGAAAASDVAGEVLGVQVHGQLPGAEGPPDNLEIMKGVGPKFVIRLHENGVTRFDQISRLTDNEVSILDDKMGPFKGRLRRDRVVEQANYLARGDTDGFEAQFGKLGSVS